MLSFKPFRSAASADVDNEGEDETELGQSPPSPAMNRPSANLLFNTPRLSDSFGALNQSVPWVDDEESSGDDEGTALIRASAKAQLFPIANEATANESVSGYDYDFTSTATSAPKQNRFVNSSVATLPRTDGLIQARDGAVVYGERSTSSGKSRSCKVCGGKGRVRRDAGELVALVPYSDARLKPRRTKCRCRALRHVSLLVYTHRCLSLVFHGGRCIS
eukprot:m.401514 g.401514  ORF g.401514 m.401514 type:complete len:219 (+) comp21167_c0_seq4:141-797(+)